jgi:hypothetical protein
MAPLSRRSVLAILSAAAVPTAVSQLAQPDARLLTLSRQFELIATQLDDHMKYPSSLDLELFGRVYDEIAATSATTIQGLCAKARIGCWTLLGDFEAADDSAAGAPMAFSIMRDLIRIHAPDLERPGAVRMLVAEIEKGAG